MLHQADPWATESEGGGEREAAAVVHLAAYE
jgi:hypothetical protein